MRRGDRARRPVRPTGWSLSRVEQVELWDDCRFFLLLLPLGLPVLLLVTDLWRGRSSWLGDYAVAIPGGAFAALILGPLTWARHRTAPDPEPLLRTVLIWALVLTWCAGLGFLFVAFTGLFGGFAASSASV